MTDSFDAQELLSDARWVRQLARSLAIDESAADDLAQETWLVALRDGPKHLIRSPRAWLRRVLTHAAGHEARRSALRKDREVAAARAEALPSTIELAEHAELQRSLAEAVLALAEPYRSTILWRYFGNLSSEEIAKRLGVPSSTVRNRLRRGLDQLRTALERGGGSKWQAQCLALAASKPSGLAGAASKSWTEGITMGINGKLAVATAAVLLVSIALWIELGPSARIEALATVRETAELRWAVPSNERDSVISNREPVAQAEVKATEIDPTESAVEVATPGRKLEELRDQLRSHIEDSMLGYIDPAFYLDLAQQLTKLEPGALAPERSRQGASIYLLEGEPDGMQATYQVHDLEKSTPYSRVESVRVTLDRPSDPYIVAGIKRSPPEVHVTLWRDHDGKVCNLSILTNLYSREPPTEIKHADGALYSYDVQKPLAQSGYVSAITDRLENIPITIVGGKWPDFDALNGFGAGMHGLYAKVNK
ncbi:MAG TPA: RNA polymerase sigma factor [Planctomycetota bacterium]|nr:RNA polymerase sigma factor [Planctomycetota bacterium]